MSDDDGDEPTAKANKFSLEGRTAGPAAPKKWASYTPADRERLLEGYREVPPAAWAALTGGTRVRYVLKTGEFNTGGTLTTVPLAYAASSVAKGATGKYIKIRMRGYEWSVALDAIETLYLRTSAEFAIMLALVTGAVTGLNANIKTVADYVRPPPK